MAEIDNLQIKIEYDVSDSLKSVKKLTDSLRALSKATEAFSGLKTDGVKNLSSVARALTRLSTMDMSGVTRFSSAVRQLQNLNLKSIFSGFADIDVKNIRNLQQAFSALAGAANAAQRVTRAVQQQGSSARRRATPAVPDVQSARQESGGAPVTSRQINPATKAMERFASVSRKMSSVASGAFNACKKAASGLFAALKKIGSLGLNAFKGIAKGLKSIETGFKRSGAQSGTFLAKLKQIISRSIIWKGLQYITRGVAEGLKNLARYSTEANAAMSELSSMSLYMKNSFGAALYPAIQMIINALRALVSAISSAMNAINMLLSALGGKSTFIKAKLYAKDYADELDHAGGSAKKLKAELMGFDEINQFSPDNSGGGGGGNLDDFSSMFETAEIDKAILDAVRLNDFSGIGRAIADKLNKALEGIDWTNIQGKAKKLAAGIATGINGFVEDIDGEGIGRAIAEALNTVTEFADDFITWTNFEDLGKRIGEALTGFMKNIDAFKLGRLLRARFTLIFNMLKGLIESNPWEDIGKSLADTVNGFFDFTEDETKQASIADTISGFISGAFDSVRVFASNTEIERIGNGVKNIIVRAIQGIEADNLAVTVGNVIEFSIKFIKSITLTPDEQTTVGKKIADALNKIVKNVKFSDVVTTIGELLSSALGTLQVTISETDFAAIGKNVGEALAGVVEYVPKLAGKLVGIGLKFAEGVVDAVIAYLKEHKNFGLEDIKDAVKDFFEAMNLDAELRVTLAKVALVLGALKLGGLGLKAFGSSIAGALGLKAGSVIGVGSSLRFLGTLGFTLTAALETIQAIQEINSGDTKQGIVDAIQAALSAAGIVATLIGGATGAAIVFGLKIGLRVAYSLSLLNDGMSEVVDQRASIYEAIKDHYGANFADNITEGMFGKKGSQYAAEVALRANPNENELVTGTYLYNPKTGEMKPEPTGKNISRATTKRDEAELSSDRKRVLSLFKQDQTILSGTKDDLSGFDGKIKKMREWITFTENITGEISANRENLKAAVEDFPDLTLLQEDINEFYNTLNENELSSEGVDKIRGLSDVFNTVYDDMKQGWPEMGEAERVQAVDTLQTAYDNVVVAVEDFYKTAQQQTEANDSVAESVAGASDSLLTYGAAIGAVSGSLSDFHIESAGSLKSMKEAADTIEQISEVIDAVDLDDTFAPLAVSAGESAKEVEELKTVIIEVPTEKQIKFSANTEDFTAQIDTIMEKVSSVAGEKEITFTLRSSAVVTAQLTSIRGIINSIPRSVTLKVHASLTSDAKKFLEALKTLMKSAKVTAGQIQAVISTGSVIPKFAKGGFPNSGELFIANENGRQEMIGRIGNRSAVANQDQIGDAIFRYMDAHDRQSGGDNTEQLAAAIVRGLKQAGIGAMYLDGKMIAGSVNRESQRIGRPAITF